LPSTVIVIDAIPLAESAETATLTLPFIVDPFSGELIATVGGGLVVPVLVVPVLVVPVLEVEIVPVLVAPVPVVPVPVLVVPVLKDAKAKLSTVVDQARRGKPSVITRHGKPKAVILGFTDWERLSRVSSFGRHVGTA
jgi:prevent-host-death family protein